MPLSGGAVTGFPRIIISRCGFDRLSRTFPLREKYKLMLVGEVLNVTNLSGHSGNLSNAATFGQLTRRVDQVFGSGGPRAFQFGARVGF